MKRNLNPDKPTEIKAPFSPKGQERELEERLDFMVKQISERFRNNAIKGLNKGTVEKFADAQVGNFAKVFLGLTKGVKRKILNQFSDDRIDDMVAQVLGRVDKRNQQAINEAVERAIGIPSKELTSTEGLTFNVNALMLETSQWIKKLRDETLEAYTANTLQAMATGGSLEEIMSRFDGLVEERRGQAKFNARNQVANFNSMTTKIRAQNLGVTKAIWVTAGDERVRQSHVDRDGKEFELSDGLFSSVDGKTLLPGIDFGCRCTYELILD